MSLSGNLEVFPLEEVLRLLSRSHQDGCLQVRGEGSGRIYLEKGSLTFATVEQDEALRPHLVASGLVSEEGLSRVDVSGGSLSEALVPSAASSSLTELIREQCVESLYRIRRPGRGAFDFQIDARPHYPTGQSFDVEAIISEAERRAADWADIETVVPELAIPWRMVPTIDEDSVNLSDTAWRFLAAMEGASSVTELAGRLGSTTFQTARRMAELSRARLVEQVTAAAPVTTPVTAPVTSPLTTELPAPSHEVADTPGPDWPGQPVQAEPATDRSWWNDENSETAETDSEELPDESFLETVFSELDKTEDIDDDTDDEDGAGFGLLRRRGLGAAFRELADS
jgi:hypothetical protein